MSTNQLKSIFVTLFFSLAVLMLLHSIAMLVVQGTTIGFSWFGAFLGNGVVVAFLIALFTKQKARTSPALSRLLLGTLIGLLITLVAEVQWLAIVYAAFAFVGTFVYVFWYSFLDRPVTPQLAVGQPLPEFTVQTLSGLTMSSQILQGQPAVLLFYRGNWCPLCSAQIKELAQQYQQLEQAGVNVWLISPQPEAQSEKLAKQYGVNFQFMRDVDHAAAKQLQLFHPSGLPAGLQWFGYDNDTVYPTVLVTDAEGNIIFADVTDNYRVRPEPDTFMRVLGI